MSHPSNSEDRRKAMLLKVPKDFKKIESWPDVDDEFIEERYRPRVKALRHAAKLFLLNQSAAELGKAANMRPSRVLDYLDVAIAPWVEGTGITGVRAFVPYLVQKERTRRADLPVVEEGHAETAGFGGAFEKLFADHPAIETELTKFLNGYKRPNKVTPKTLHNEFQLICKDQKLTERDYPLNCESKGFWPLCRWFKTKYLPEHLMPHIRRNSGRAAAVAAGHQMGDGESRTPRCDYLAWVIDECDSNIEGKVEIPSTRWGGEVVKMRRFPVLRLRSTGDFAVNIAFHVCFTRQAKGTDIIQLFRNAVLGQPMPPMVDPNMRPVDGAGFPQNLFKELSLVVPIVVYLDNALAHLFNDLQELVMRLFGGRVVLGAPGSPKGRPEIESNIHRTRKCFVLQLPGALGSGPQDPLRQIAARPTEQLVHANHIAQGIYCVLANENVSDTSSAGYLDGFTRLKALLARGDFEPNYLPEHKRSPYNFCAPIRKRVQCDITKSGRLPFIRFGDRRYSSQWLKSNPPDGVKEYWVLQDSDDLRTAILLDDRMSYVDTLNCEGAWGRVPFDSRIQQIYDRRKRAARFKLQPRDLPLFEVLQFLCDGAKSDWSMAQDYAYFMTYLKRMVSPEELATAQMEYGFEDVPMVYADGYVPPTRSATPAPAPAGYVTAAPRAAPVAPRLPARRFSVPRGMR
ncbi:hypothetical protein [Roseateles toxinivorans]|uniref:Integrase catalytic domain-containing protein n=1 Tax=Roseateles toxinivorans TaxID=270368 RepID=A0A4R6QSX5_9BURK|nr:hypothetical protein [Roseateles toxinivorans]TDP74750.1 hypothetical protein DES47_101816 [Roseateles toxinivorans]